MKKIWKMRRDSEAVSPVIATILMVAITVVLAAVLYVMVMGFGGPATQTPTGAFTSATKVEANSYKLTFGTISPETKFIDCKIAITDKNGTVNTVTITDTDTLIDVISTGSVICRVKFVDLGGDGKISVGDYMTLEGTHLEPGEWTAALIYTATGGTICSKTWTVS